MTERERIYQMVDQTVKRTPEHALVCPPLHRALMVRIAQELSATPEQPTPRKLPKKRKTVSRETKRKN